MGEAKRKREQFEGPLGAEAARPGMTSPDLLGVTGGVVFLFVLMMLPMVGPAGARTAHYPVNFSVFLLVLLASASFAFGALALKLRARRVDGGRFPALTAALCAACAGLLLALLTGALRGPPFPA
jgi:ABC-type Fe3+-siderophore transport system permease subunit